MKNIKINFIYNIAYQILVILVPLITTPYVSQVLGSENIGVYSYTNSIVTYFVLFASLSFSMYGQREIAFCQDNKKSNSITFYEIQLFKFLTYSISVAIYVLFCLFTDQYKIYFVINIVYLIGNYFDISWFFQGNENFKIVTVRNFFVKIIGCILIFCLVNTKDDLYLYILINAVVNFTGFLSLWLYLPKCIEKVGLSELKIFRNLRQIIELFLPMLASNIYNVLDKTMLGLSDNTRQLGYYEQTTKIITLCLALVTALGPVVYPRMAALYAEGNIKKMKEYTNLVFKFVIMTGCPIFFGVVGISDILSEWFFGKDFNGIENIIKLYSVVLVIIPLSLLSEYSILSPMKKQNKGTIAVFVGALSNFILNLLLIPRLYAVGATIATIIGESIVTIIHLYFIKEFLSIKSVFSSLIKYISISAIMLVGVLSTGAMIKSIALPLPLVTLSQVLIGGMIYLFLLFVIKDELLSMGIGILKSKIKTS